MPIYGEFVPPSQGLGSALVSNVPGGVSAWDNSVALIQDGLAATQVYGLSLQNNTAATNAVRVQNSPTLEFIGHIWDTDGADYAGARVQMYVTGTSTAVPITSFRIQHQRVDTLTYYDAVVIDSEPAGVAESIIQANYYGVFFNSQGIGSIRTISTGGIRGTDPMFGGSGYNKGLDFGYGYSYAGVLGYDTFSPTTAANRYHSRFNCVYSPNAAGLAANFAAVQINPQFSGTTAGYATALAMALKTSLAGHVGLYLFDFGTTGTDYFTGFVSNFRLEYITSQDVRIQLRTAAGGNASYNLYEGSSQHAAIGFVAATGPYLAGIRGYGFNIYRLATDNFASNESLRVTAPADARKFASVETYDVYFAFNRTTQWATGAIATQRAFYIESPTYAFVGASTITNAATVAIKGSPKAGANCTFGIDNSHALWIADSYALEEVGSAICLENTHAGIVDVDYPSPMLQFINRGNDGATEYTMRSRLRSHGVVNPTLYFGFRSNAAAWDDAVQFNYDGVDGHIGVNDYSTSILHLTRTAKTGIVPAMFSIHTPADTARTAGAEYNDVYWDFGSHTVEWATGALATQRAVYIAAPTYAFVGASVIDTAATVYIQGTPNAGANATIYKNYALWIADTTGFGDIFVALENTTVPADDSNASSPMQVWTGKYTTGGVTHACDVGIFNEVDFEAYANSGGAMRFVERISHTGGAMSAWHDMATLTGTGPLDHYLGANLTIFDGTATMGTSTSFQLGSVKAKAGLFYYESIGTTQTPGVLLWNGGSLVGAGAQQYSPALQLTGWGWKTDAVAAAREVDFAIQNRTVQGTSNPSGVLDFLYRVNLGAWSTPLWLSSIGELHPSLCLGLTEIATPANPSANNVKIYAKDNGIASPNNRTQLIVLWSDGVETVIAESAAS